MNMVLVVLVGSGKSCDIIDVIILTFKANMIIHIVHELHACIP